ncbi:MAG TPA: LuxR C-terminal-related transcriptional regulator [Anaerolineae bacterium]
MIEETSPALSERELEVLKLVATGASNQQIARALVISPNTVKVHLRNIFEKLDVQSRTEATLEAVRRGWVNIEGAVVIEGVTVTSSPPAEKAETSEPSPAAEPEPLAPAHTPIGPWQRLYLIAAACTIVLALFLPGWWQSRGQTPNASAFTDQGRPQLSPAVRQLNRWTSGAPLPEGRSRLALVASSGKLYAIGGETASGIGNEMTIFDPASNGWLPGPSKPTAVSNITGVLLDQRIFVPGGTVPPGAVPSGSIAIPTRPAAAIATSPLSRLYQSPIGPASTASIIVNDGVTNAVEVYDTLGGGWFSVAPLPAPRAAYALAAYGGKLYLFGGWDGARYRAETFIYDPVTNRWTTGTPMPAPRAFLGAAPLSGLIYVVGGYDGRQELDTVTAYDAKAEGRAAVPWSIKASLNQPRAGLSVLALGARLYAIGGGWNAGLTFNEQYDIISSAWSRTESPVIEQWRNLGLAAEGEKIYAVGGWSGGYLTTNEQYQALYRVQIPSSSTP